MESFPKELPYGQNGSNNGSCWTLFDSFICEDADISKDPPSNNSNTMKSVYSIMRKACDCMPYTTSSSVPSSTDPAKLRKYDNCQLFKKFDCQYPGCSLKYAAFRVKGVIAIYTHGRHDHKPHTSRHGLNLWIKQLLLKQQSPDNRNPCMSVFNYLKNIERCTDPEEASRHNKTHLLHGVAVNETLKRQIDQAWNTLKNDPKWRINVSNVCLKIGSSMESLINYINSDGRKMEVDKFASITSKELEEMSKEELDKIIILDTDIGENEDHSYKYIIWSTKRNLIIIDDIIEMSKTRLVGIQFESDFAHDIVNSYQVGNLGVSDLSKRYHALIWAISVTENQTVASKMTKLIVTILKKRRHIPHKKPFGKSCMTRDKELSDGSLALKAAVEKTDGVDHALCLSHMLRCNYSKSGKGHGSGTKGSCLRYLKSKGVREEDIGTICAVFLLIRFISTEMEWKQLRPLWERECMELLQYLDSKLEEVMDHLFGHYFAFDLKWAYIHEDGEVHSTNGLEKGWDVLRGEVDHLQKNDLLTKNDSRLSSLLTATSQWNHRLHNKPFVKAPLQHKCDWDAINDFRLEFPFELCLSLCYSLDSQELVTSFEVDDDRHSYVFYFPSEAIIERCRSAIDQKTNPMKSHRPSRNQATITRVSFDNNTGVQVAFQDTVNQALYHEHPYVEPSEDTFEYISRRIFRVKKNFISKRLTVIRNNLKQDVTAGRYEPTEANEKESLIEILNNMTDEKLYTTTLKEIRNIKLSDEESDSTAELSMQTASSHVNSTSHTLHCRDMEERNRHGFSEKWNEKSPSQPTPKKVDKKKTPSRASNENGSNSLHYIQGQTNGNFCRTYFKRWKGRIFVRCTCDEHRIDGTCWHEKFVALIFGKRYPPPECVGQDEAKGWADIRDELISLLKEKNIIFNGRGKDCSSKPPKTDPFERTEEEVRMLLNLVSQNANITDSPESMDHSSYSKSNVDDLHNKSTEELQQLLDLKIMQYNLAKKGYNKSTEGKDEDDQKRQEMIRKIRSYEVGIPPTESASIDSLRNVHESLGTSSNVPQVMETDVYHASIGILPNVPGPQLGSNNLQNASNFQFNSIHMPQVQNGTFGVPQAQFPPHGIYGSHNNFNRQFHGNLYNMQFPSQPTTVFQPYPQPFNLCIQNHFVQPQNGIFGNSEINNTSESHDETATKTDKNTK